MPTYILSKQAHRSKKVDIVKQDLVGGNTHFSGTQRPRIEPPVSAKALLPAQTPDLSDDVMSHDTAPPIETTAENVDFASYSPSLNEPEVESEQPEAPAPVLMEPAPKLQYLARDVILRVGELCDALKVSAKSTATAVAAGEFSKSGSGHLGNLYRLVETIEGQAQIDAWSGLLSVSASLWDADFMDEALEFMTVARRDLNTPEVFQDRVKSSIDSAQNGIYAKRANERFASGDTSGALGLAQNMTGPEGNAYRADLVAKSTYRSKTRRITFAASGCLIAVLMVVSVFGVFRMSATIANPPEINWPEPPGRDLLEAFSQPNTQAPTPSAQDLPDSPAEANTTPVSDSIEGPELAVAPEDTPNPISAGELNQDPQVDEVITAAPAPSGEAIYNCAVGQAVSRRSIEIVLASSDRSKASAVENFVTKVNSACAALAVSQSDLDMVVATIAPEKIEAMARNIAGS